MSEREPCPSCDRDLSYPGAPGHECYTYDEWRANQAVNAGRPQRAHPATMIGRP